MNLNLFIARRYLFSKKSTNAINLISAISVVGTMVGTMALIIILSVFNGLEDLIKTRYNVFDPDYKIEPREGKVLHFDSLQQKAIEALPYVDAVMPVLEENALVKYKDKYHPARLKGVPAGYRSFNGLDTMLVEGTYQLFFNHHPAALVGQEIATVLSLSVGYPAPLRIYVPKRTGKISMNPQHAFKTVTVYPSAVFSIEPEVDNYIILPFSFVEHLLAYSQRATSLEINVNKNIKSSVLVADLQRILKHQSFVVKNRFQQHEAAYKIMQSEKVVVFLILILILLVASFNIIGSLSMLIIEKEHDIFTFFALGFTRRRIQKIFQTEGMLITGLGVFLGIVFGVSISLLQQHFGFVKLQGANNASFIVQAYPVAVRVWDVIIVFFTVLFIGYIASRYPVQFIVRKKLKAQANN